MKDGTPRILHVSTDAQRLARSRADMAAIGSLPEGAGAVPPDDTEPTVTDELEAIVERRLKVMLTTMKDAKELGAMLKIAVSFLAVKNKMPPPFGGALEAEE